MATGCKRRFSALYDSGAQGRYGGLWQEKGKAVSDEEKPAAGDTHRVFLEMLENSGFFQQINALEKSLKIIAGELKSFGENVNERAAESDNLAAHVLAIESLLAVMLKAYPISADELDGEIKDRTAALSGNPDGSPTVRALALDILEKSKG